MENIKSISLDGNPLRGIRRDIVAVSNRFKVKLFMFICYCFILDYYSLTCDFNCKVSSTYGSKLLFKKCFV